MTPTAQDLALLSLATRQGHLTPAEADGLRGEAPAANALLRLLSSERVSGLLRDLAQGSFVCGRCAERLPYFSLAGLSGLDCPLCAAPLEHVPNPRAASRAPRAARPREQQVLGRWSRAPSLPRRLGAYVLLEELGRGANGVVYRARRSRRDYALKTLHPGVDAEGLARFRRETSIAYRLRHPGVVPVHEVGAQEGVYYCVMELVAGQTLRRCLTRGPLAPAEAARLVGEVAAAAHAAHEQGVVHRDLKPSNILLDPRAGPRITDFGVARDQGCLEVLTCTGQILGTPAYMAPEQLLEGEGDARADVYALGVILYECLTGVRPFNAPTLIVLAEQVLHQPPPPLRERAPAVSPRLEAICLRALAKTPGQRWPSAALLAAALAGCAEEAALSESRSG